MWTPKYTYHTLGDGSVWEVELQTGSWRRKMAHIDFPVEYEEPKKEPKMAGITKIGQHEVTEIKRDAAQVGCTKVTRAEVEELLKKMDSAPVEKDFKITKWINTYPGEFITFGIQHKSNGWIATETAEKGQGEFKTYDNRSAGFCLDRQKAIALFEFLGGVLGYYSYTPEGYTSARFTKV